MRGRSAHSILSPNISNNANLSTHQNSAYFSRTPLKYQIPTSLIKSLLTHNNMASPWSDTKKTLITHKPNQHSIIHKKNQVQIKYSNSFLVPKSRRFSQQIITEKNQLKLPFDFHIPGIKFKNDSINKENKKISVKTENFPNPSKTTGRSESLLGMQLFSTRDENVPKINSEYKESNSRNELKLFSNTEIAKRICRPQSSNIDKKYTQKYFLNIETNYKGKSKNFMRIINKTEKSHKRHIFMKIYKENQEDSPESPERMRMKAIYKI